MPAAEALTQLLVSRLPMPLAFGSDELEQSGIFRRGAMRAVGFRWFHTRKSSMGAWFCTRDGFTVQLERHASKSKASEPRTVKRRERRAPRSARDRSAPFMPLHRPTTRAPRTTLKPHHLAH